MVPSLLELVANNPPDVKNLREDALNQKRFMLAQLLRRTEEILQHAQHSDWESVEVLEQARQTEIAACFANANEEDSPLMAEALATLIHMNDQISQLVRAAKDEVVQSQRAREAQNSVAHQYRDGFQTCAE